MLKLKIEKLPLLLKAGYVFIFFLGLAYLWWPVSPFPAIGKRYDPQRADTAKLLGNPEGIYFTNKEKREVYHFYQQNFLLKKLAIISRSTEWNTSLAKTIINDSAHDNISFLTSFGFPMKQNRLIRGFGEVNAAATAQKNPKKIISFSPEGEEEYSLRLAVYPLRPHPIAQLFVWLAIWATFPLVVSQIRQGIEKIKELNNNMNIVPEINSG